MASLRLQWLTPNPGKLSAVEQALHTNSEIITIAIDGLAVLMQRVEAQERGEEHDFNAGDDDYKPTLFVGQLRNHPEWQVPDPESLSWSQQLRMHNLEVQAERVSALLDTGTCLLGRNCSDLEESEPHSSSSEEEEEKEDDRVDEPDGDKLDGTHTSDKEEGADSHGGS